MSALLIPTLDQVLNSCSMTLADIDVIGIATGPGLFTGIRVGLATVKGLLVSEAKPVVPVNSLEALGFKYFNSLSKPSGIVIPMIDARRGEIYIAAYESFFNSDARGLKEIMSPRLIQVEETEALLKDFKPGCHIGSGATGYKEYLEQHLKHSEIIFRSDFLAAEIGRYALDRFHAGAALTDLSQLMPLYIRKPDAEQNLLNKAS
jgi:tRNA threonylcarbamoyladenosine biosynthesis protein TsaB